MWVWMIKLVRMYIQTMTRLPQWNGFVDLENISIDKNGKITGTNKDTGDPVVVAYIALGSVETSMACFIPRAPTIRRAMPLGISGWVPWKLRHRKPEK